MQHIRGVLTAIVMSFCLVFTVNAQSVALPGHIAVLGEDFNIYVVGGEFSSPMPLTRDATELRHYQFPMWSTDGRLAFFCCDPFFSSAFSVEAYVASTDLTVAKLMYNAQNESYTYAAWSPANCAGDTHCRDLALLLTRPSASFKVEILRQTVSGVSAHTAATGAPFYFGWSGDGQRMIWHRDNRLLSFFNLETRVIMDSEVVPRFFQAPAWSPVDERVAVMIADSPNTTALVVLQGDEQYILKGGLQGLTNFSWSPDGRYLAYRLVTDKGLTAMQVVDSQSGDVVSSSFDSNVIAFFWSPDSTRLAYLTPSLSGGAASAQFVNRMAAQPQRITINWNVLDITTDQNRYITAFTPTETMVYLLSYFDQFGQSHRLWSPDSRYLVYGEIMDTAHRVSFVDTLSDNPVPMTVMPGEIGIWSYN